MQPIDGGDHDQHRGAARVRHHPNTAGASATCERVADSATNPRPHRPLTTGSRGRRLAKQRLLHGPQDVPRVIRRTQDQDGDPGSDLMRKLSWSAL
jgi:hypothetical protein